ncbi:MULTISPECIES: J domain-containing protein [unclassified Aureimonas]|uniref:J domain-containing protein n=1 Tax=unclassified Aureimonas TaxID=2615206 RepID=UPI0006F38F5A|nr:MULTISPECIES: DnaJ domain-containing protein [unclassified Aureimonas]KQT53992.1 molecular chaperone DnaJ [Aureimonas sp. Leaf427]KQT71568.1 molecular chaperone DnaJ [Aureimonas sp. Leaf460]
MKLDSKYFDTIRVRGRTKAPEKAKVPDCAWDGCDKPGIYKAPRGRDHEGQYLHFCVDHVRQYNKSYNYFSGLNDQDIQTYLKDSLTGHRPTWKMGADGATPGAEAPKQAARRAAPRARDPFNLFEDGTPRPKGAPRVKKVRSLEAKALITLDLTEEAGGEAIRTRYKSLVKQLHPDANGGDRGHEDRLREVIQAYKLLKQSGFC